MQEGVQRKRAIVRVETETREVVKPLQMSGYMPGQACEQPWASGPC